MTIKRLFKLTILVTLLSMFIAGCGSSATNSSKDNASNNKEENETITLKLSTYFATTSLLWPGATEPWMKRVTELTNGKVQFKTFPAEQLGKAYDQLKLTKDGVADISVLPTVYYPDNMPLSNMLSGLPNLSENSNQGTLAYRDLLEQNEKLLEIDYLKNGIRPLGQIVSPNYELWTTEKEIRVPEDLKGLKVRTPGGIANEVYQHIGVVPVPVSHSETYEALEKGVIDAVSYYSMAVDSSGTKELLKHAVFPHIGTVIHAISINESVWKGLPEDVQQAMIQAGQEMMEAVGPMYTEKTNEFNEGFKKDGGTIVELTPEEQEKWKKVTEEFDQKWIKEHKSGDIPYEEVLNQYKENLKKYE